MADNDWHHAAWVYDGQMLKLFIDGVLKSHDDMSGKNATLDKSSVYMVNCMLNPNFW